MKRVHFDSKGPVKWHYFFWEPWGAGGCLLRSIGFMLLLALFLFLLSQFRSCRDDAGRSETVVESPRQPVSDVIPPINEDDVVDEGGRQVVANRLNVLFGAETGQAEYNEWCERFHELYPSEDYQILFYDPNTKLMSIQVPADRRVELITLLPEQIPDIPFMVFDESVMDMGYQPNDPVFRHQDHAYPFTAIKAFDAWDITQGNPAVCVAVVDSYFDIENVEFQGTNIVHPYSVARGDSIVALPDDYDPQRPDPVYSHGTMVSAMALGAFNNGRASAGMAPKCTFMPISLGHRFGCLAMLQGILYAINHCATVINISAGLSFTEEVSSWPVEQQIAMARTELLAQEAVWKYVFDMAQRNYITIVWAAGNENVFTALDASKRGDETIKVSATDASMSKADFSNFGNFADQDIHESTLSAPGVDVPGLVPHTSGYTLVDGTSFSAPIVAGCVALVKSIDPTLTTPEIIELLQSTGRPVSGNSTIGPIVQIGPALQELENTIISYSDFASALSRGNSADSLQCCVINYLNVDDPTMLPPIFTMQIVPSGNNRGKIRYISNREPATVLEAPYTATVRGNTIVISQQATTSVGEGHDADGFNSATFTVQASERGKATVTVSDAEWWQSAVPFFVRKPRA